MDSSEDLKRPLVSIVMGSDSDLPVMRKAADALDELGVAWELDVVSAHRTPDRLYEFAAGAHLRGVAVIVAGAGGAAHLPGMVAAISPLPVIGVPIRSSNSIDGWDSVLSILQMPAGIPVATVAVDGARNAGILAAQIVSVADRRVQDALLRLKAEMRDAVLEKSRKVARRSG